MTSKILSRRSLGLCAAVAALLVVAPAGASAATGCTAPTLTQPFLPFEDFNWYAIAPGEKYDSFSASGWVLTGGARIVATTLYDGTKGYVLDMPTGSAATSPAMCITNDYPTARTMIRNLAGSTGVNVYVAYMGSNTWGPLKSTGQTKGSGTSWALSPNINIHPSSLIGWQLARFMFVANGTQSEYQLYNFYVDPRMH